MRSGPPSHVAGFPQMSRGSQVSVHILMSASLRVSHETPQVSGCDFSLPWFSVNSVPSAFYLPGIPQNFWSANSTHPSSIPPSLPSFLPSNFQSWNTQTSPPPPTSSSSFLFFFFSFFSFSFSSFSSFFFLKMYHFSDHRDFGQKRRTWLCSV